MKKPLLLILAVLMVGLFFALSGGELLADEVFITRVVNGGESSANGSVTVPFLKDSTKYTFINVAIDLNGDSAFQAYELSTGSQDEWVVRNMGVRILRDEANNFSIRIPDTEIASRVPLTVHVVLSSDELHNWDGNLKAGGASKVFTVAEIGIEDIAELYAPDPSGVRSGGFPFDFFGSAALAQDAPDKPPTVGNDVPLLDEAGETEEDITGQGSGEGRSGAPASFDEFHPNVPDIVQGRNECVPTATANSLLWLADEYHFEDKMPEGGGAAVINELKNDLNWTENGVDVQQHYLGGKRAFTERHHIPIVTHQVGGRFDTSIVSKIAEELKKGQDVEIDMEYGRYDADGNYRRVGGHMVTVVGAWTAGNSEYLDIHDPVSTGPGTLDIYQIDGTRVENYRYQGTAVTFIRYAIAESPIEEATPTPTETPDDATPEPTPEQTEPPVTQEEEARDLTRDFVGSVEMSFSHVAPGEYSEVYVSAQNNEPGTEVAVSLAGPAVDAPTSQVIVADDNGISYFVFRIFNFGTYTATVSVGGVISTSSVVVN